MTGSGTAGDAGRELQDAWLGLLGSEWGSLAVVPVDGETPAGLATAGLDDLAALLGLARRARARGEGEGAGEDAPAPAFQLLDGTGATTERAAELVARMEAFVAGGGRAVVAVDPPARSLAGLALAMAADKVLLLVRLGTPRDLAERTIQLVGRERILGCVEVRPAGRR